MRRSIQTACVILSFTILLTACGGGSSGTTPPAPTNPSVITSATPTNLLLVAPNSHNTVTVNFTTNISATVTALSMPLSPLPAGWSSANTTSPFTCASVGPGSNCTLTLQYSPNAITVGTLQLILPYTYQSNGKPETGIFTYNYSAATMPTGSVSCSGLPGALQNVSLHTAQDVPVTCSTDTQAANFQLNFGTWPAGWSLLSGSTPASISCASISSTTPCTFVLQYMPTAAATLQSFNMNYTYNAAQTGTLSIPYSAGQTVQYMYAGVQSLKTGNNEIDLCMGDPTVSLQCSNTTSPPEVSVYTYLVPQIVGLQQYVYTTDQLNGVYVCQEESNGTLGSCKIALPNNSQGDIFVMDGLAFETANNQLYAYVAQSNSTIAQCPVLSDGTFGECNTIPFSEAPLGYPFNIAFYSLGTTTYAYITSNGSGLIECTVKTDGSLANCQSAHPGGGLPSGLSGLAFDAVQTTANDPSTQTAFIYLLNGSAIYRCALNNQTGMASGCAAMTGAPSGAGSFQSMQIGFFGSNASREMVLGGNLSDTSSGIFSCTFNDNGQFTSCGNITGENSNPPVGLALQ